MATHKNCSQKLNPFVDILKSYNDNPFLNQQAEIKDFLTEGKAEWKIPQIQEKSEKHFGIC